MERFNSTTLLDIRQLNRTNAALQFSPQMAMSNDSFLMLDSNPSPSSSMDLGSLNPSLSSNITSEFSSLLESTSQNSMNVGMASSAAMPSQPQAVQHNDMLMPADEWSGNTTPSAQSSRQGFQSSSPSQCQSSVSQGQVSKAGNVENNRMQQYGYDKHLWGGSQNAHEMFGMPQQINRDGMSQAGDNQSAIRGHQQGFQAEMRKPNFSSKQSGQVLPGVSQQSGFQNHAQATNGQAGYLQQQRLCHGSNASDISSQESASQEVKGAVQPMDFEQNQASQVPSFDGATKVNMHASNHCLPQPPVYQRMEIDNQPPRFPGMQPTNQQAMFQRGPALSQPQKAMDGHRMQQCELQGDPVMQTMRSLGFQMQGINPQNTIQGQLQEQYLNANGHPLSVILQNQAPAQGQSQMPTVPQPHAQSQVANQQAAVNQQAVYQTRHLQSGSHQSPFQNNQQASFHLGQPQVNQVHQHGGNPGSHLAGIQHLSQLQARAQNSLFQGVKIGGRHLLHGSPSAPVSYVGNSIDAGVRSPMPVAVVSRCLEILMLYIQEQRNRPQDNGIGFWRKLVHDYFAPGATERWCLSSYSSSQMSRNAQGLFPMDYWFCNICGMQPGRGFEYSTDVLPRLFKIKYDSGLLEELLCLDIAEESYMVPPGKCVLEFPRAVHESVFPELRVVRYGKLRVTFNSSLKILSWEFCARVHDEVVPRKNLIQQAQQLTNLVEAEHEGSDKDASNLKAQCNAFTFCAKQLKSKLEAPNVNDLGFSKRYVRCLQIAEVVNSMKDLISFEKKTHLGPTESLNQFPTIRKLHSEGMLQQSSVTQVVSQLTQGSGNSNSPYPKMASRLSLPMRQGISFSQTPSSVLQGNDPLLTKPPSAMNPLHVTLRNQFDTRNQSLMQTQAGNQMQPPSVSHVDSVSQGQSHSNNQFLSQFTQHTPSSLQGQPLGQVQSAASGQISSQILGCQSQNINHLGQQMFDQGIAKQINFQPSNQVITQSRSLNRTGQQSLPGTPQSEMSDMRSNT